MTNVSNNVSLCHNFDSFVLFLKNWIRCIFYVVFILCFVLEVTCARGFGAF